MLIDHELAEFEIESAQSIGALGRDNLLASISSILWPRGDGQSRCYALLDASNIVFLPERLEQTGMPFACLYDDSRTENLTLAAPWLVELEEGSRFARELFTPSGPDDNPRFLLDRRPGILLLSDDDLPTLRHHLRHYTMLVDEFGVGEIFRLQEPGFMPALLDKSSPNEIATFYRHIASLIHWRPALHTGRWEFLVARPGRHLPEAPRDRTPVTILGPVQRRALRETLSERKARQLAMTHADDDRERAARADVYFRLYASGYDGEPTLLEAYEVVSRLPPDAREAFWAAVRSEKYSLRFIVLSFAKAHGLLETMS